MVFTGAALAGGSQQVGTFTLAPIIAAGPKGQVTVTGASVFVAGQTVDAIVRFARLR